MPEKHHASARKALSPEHLRDENQRLKDLVVKLTVIILKNIFLERQSSEKQSSEHVLETAEVCFDLARVSNMRPKVADALETLGHELSERAVEIDTEKDRRNSH